MTDEERDELILLIGDALVMLLMRANDAKTLEQAEALVRLLAQARSNQP